MLVTITCKLPGEKKSTLYLRIVTARERGPMGIRKQRELIDFWFSHQPPGVGDVYEHDPFSRLIAARIAKRIGYIVDGKISSTVTRAPQAFHYQDILMADISPKQKKLAVAAMEEDSWFEPTQVTPILHSLDLNDYDNRKLISFKYNVPLKEMFPGKRMSLQGDLANIAKITAVAHDAWNNANWVIKPNG